MGPRGCFWYFDRVTDEASSRHTLTNALSEGHEIAPSAALASHSSCRRRYGQLPRIDHARDLVRAFLRPWARRRAALMSDTALYANNAKQQGNNAALGEPNILISHDRVVVISKQAVSMLQRFLESLAPVGGRRPCGSGHWRGCRLGGPVSESVAGG